MKASKLDVLRRTREAYKTKMAMLSAANNPVITRAVYNVSYRHKNPTSMEEQSDDSYEEEESSDEESENEENSAEVGEEKSEIEENSADVNYQDSDNISVRSDDDEVQSDTQLEMEALKRQEKIEFDDPRTQQLWNSAIDRV